MAVKKFDEFDSSDTIYFVCHRVRAEINLKYAKEFLEDKRGWNKIKFHDSYNSAREELVNGFYDDSDYDVVKIENGELFISRGREWRRLK